MWRHTVRVLIMLLVAGLSPGRAYAGPPPGGSPAQNVELTPPKCGKPQLVVISGGISRGSYQGGQIYVLSNWLRELNQECLAKGAAPPEITVAGSSAGSINAALLAMDLLSNPNPPWAELPEMSLYARAWLPLGFNLNKSSLDQLAIPPCKERQCDENKNWQALVNTATLGEVAKGVEEEVARRTLLSRGQLPSPEHPATNWAGGAGRFTRVRLAMTTARHTPVSDDQGLLMDVTESFGFELTITDTGTIRALPLEDHCAIKPNGPCPLESAYTSAWDQSYRGPMHSRQLSDGSLPLRTITWLAVGSSSIPVAFPLRRMSCGDFRALSPSHPDDCYVSDANQEENRTVGEEDRYRDEEALWFMDGGTLEGNPLRVAEHFAQSKEQMQLRRTGAPEPNFYYLDPDLVGTSLKPPPVKTEMWERYLQILGMEGSSAGLLTAMRNQSISLLLTEDASAWSRGSFIATQTPPYGNLIGAFLAFYDRSFRIWDLYAGMADTLNALFPEDRETNPIVAASLYPVMRQVMCGNVVPGQLDAKWQERLESLISMTPLGTKTTETSSPTEDGTSARQRPEEGWGGGTGTKDQLWENLQYLSVLHREASWDPKDGTSTPDGNPGYLPPGCTQVDTKVVAQPASDPADQHVSGLSKMILSLTQDIHRTDHTEDADKQAGETTRKAEPSELAQVDERKEEKLVKNPTLGKYTFVPRDLGDGTLHEELREHMSWQLAQLANRDAITSYNSVGAIASITNQAVLGGPTHLAIGVATPFHDHRLPAVAFGIGKEAWQAGHWFYPVEFQVGVDLGHPVYQDAPGDGLEGNTVDLTEWEGALALDTRVLGLGWGATPENEHLGVGPHHSWSLAVQGVVRTQLEANCVEGDDGGVTRTDESQPEWSHGEVAEGQFQHLPGWSRLWGPEQDHCLSVVPGLNFRFTYLDVLYVELMGLPYPFYSLVNEEDRGTIYHLQMGVYFPPHRPGLLWPNQILPR